MSASDNSFQSSRATAEYAGLHYSTDDVPGISRRRCGAGFEYKCPDGRRLLDPSARERILGLGIPPAWRNVWINPDPRGHLAATGIDARGRKQYRYNADFIAARDAAKFDHLLRFAEVLPKLRRRVTHDLGLPDLPREKVLATVAFLLETTLSRVGNEEYVKTNRSFGLTTLRNRHVRVRGDELRFVFKGKSGKKWRLGVHDRRVAKVVRACQELPGQHLFEYYDAHGTEHLVGSADVNAYLHQATGENITAKDFRTWFGTVEAALALDQCIRSKGVIRKSDLRAAIARAADRLGNTVAICRKCYVHPALKDSCETNDFALPPVTQVSRVRGLSSGEQRVLAFLKSALVRRRRRRRS